MKRTARVFLAVAIAAALMLTAATSAAPADYSPALAGASSADSRFTASGAAGFAPRTAAQRVAAVVKKRTAGRRERSTRPAAPAPAPLTEAQRAQQILNGLIAKYPILQGTTVEMGYAQGYQAVCYYRSGRIVISPTHTATLERILNHEIWHVIDFRADGAINWGENLPPANASSFAG